MQDVRALFFDVLGTVVDWRGGVSREVERFLARHGSDADPGEFTDVWAGLYYPQTESVRNGGRPFASLDALNLENLGATLEIFSVDRPPDLAEALRDLNRAWHRLDPWPDAVTGLARLKRRFLVAPLSGANTSMLVDIAKRAGLPWDAVLGADVVKAYKPAPEAYLATADLLDLRPEQACLVAAHNDDLAAARRCGMRTAFVARPAEHGPAQTTDLEPLDDWDMVARDFLDLADRLGA